jgi:hypothetical protein
MSTTENQHNLGIDLRFSPEANPELWRQIFDGIIEWEPRLRPSEWLEASDPEQFRQPWSAQAATDLFQRCAQHLALARIIEAETGPTGAITVRSRKSEVAILIALPRPDEALHRYILDLLGRLATCKLPTLGMMFDLNAKHDAEVIFQGLSGLIQVPPYLFVSARAVEAIGRERVKSVPCTVQIAPGDGLLLISRPDPWIRRIGNELRRARAVEQHLGISPKEPLVLL